MDEKFKQIRIVDIDKLDVYQDKRNCYSEIEDFVNSHKGTKGQICTIGGLLSTGKTVLLNQIAKELHAKGYKCLYLSCSDEYENIIKDRNNNIVHKPEINELYELLNSAIKEDYNYVFIDGITLIKDFVGQGNVLSNYYGNQGLNIIVAGTDSLSFTLLSQDDMMDRLKPVHTSYVSFSEYNRLLGKGLNDYIQFGGTLKEESPYKDGSSTIEYTNKAIVKNIIRSVRGNEHKDTHALTLLYPEDDIVSTIHRCINQMNQDFLVSAINRNNGIFESHPLHLGVDNDRNFLYRNHLDVEMLDVQIKKSLEVLNKDEMHVNMRQEDVDVIRKFLEDLDLVLTVPTYLSVEGEQPVRGRNMQIISQAGMVYSHATELLRLITSDEHWKNLKVCGLENKEKFIEKAERQIKGAILANLVIYDTYKALHENYYVTKIRRNSDGKEVNLAIVDKQYKDTYLFEVGYSQYKADNQVKNLANEEFNNYIEESFGKIKGRYVIYTGENDTLESALGEIKFFSAELFFKSVVNVNNVENLLDLLN
ncbi:AAA family ATPase [uncultured Phascolarctobacterium sp.]|uniref:AAA family ATPase n=1 Tax=uncultured Phascolarctobacterium sp. TaxID=512296 RepID=UPI0025F4503A|nr:AAA family ATPase [uncultured Phascolarctobacterium sp.]